MDGDRVFAQFLALAALDEQEGAVHRPLCDAAVRALTARLRDGELCEDDAARLELAAAADAYYGYTLLTGQGEALSQVTLGHLSLRMDAQGGSVQAWRDHCFALVADLLTAGDFAFLAV